MKNCYGDVESSPLLTRMQHQIISIIRILVEAGQAKEVAHL